MCVCVSVYVCIYIKCFVYKAEVTTDQSLKIYFGASEGEFKFKLQQPHIIIP